MKFTKTTSLIIIGITILVLYCTRSFITYESFVTIPSMTIPLAPKGKSSQLDTLNGNWRAILDYVSANPEKAQVFIADVKEKFFGDDCQLKQPRIDFQNLANTYRPVFT